MEDHLHKSWDLTRRYFGSGHSHTVDSEVGAEPSFFDISLFAAAANDEGPNSRTQRVHLLFQGRENTGIALVMTQQGRTTMRGIDDVAGFIEAEAAPLLENGVSHGEAVRYVAQRLGIAIVPVRLGDD